VSDTCPTALLRIQQRKPHHHIIIQPRIAVRIRQRTPVKIKFVVIKGIYQPTTGNVDGQLPGDWESVGEIFTLEADKILKL
jgi:hypothetical protein